MLVCKLCERAITLPEHKGEKIILSTCEYCVKGLAAWNEYCRKHDIASRIVEPQDIGRMLEDTVYRVHRQPEGKSMKRQERRDRWNRKGRKYG